MLVVVVVSLITKMKGIKTKTDREIEEELFREYLEGNYDIIMGFLEYCERNKSRKVNQNEPTNLQAD